MGKRKQHERRIARRPQALEGIIEQLYVAFERVPHPKHLASCPCCHTQAEKKHLTTTHRRFIEAETILGFCWDFPYTIGEPDDFRYFVPRILEVIWQQQDQFHLESFARCLEKAAFRTWPEAQQGATERVYMALCHQLTVEPFVCD